MSVTETVDGDIAASSWTDDDSLQLTVELLSDGHRMHVTGRDLEVAAAALQRRGMTPREIADRCKVTERSVDTALSRPRRRVAERRRLEALGIASAAAAVLADRKDA